MPTSASVCVTGETDRPIDCSIDGLIDRVIDHLIDRLIYGLIGGLIHGLINRRAVPPPWGLVPFRPVTLRPCLSAGLPFFGIEPRLSPKRCGPKCELHHMFRSAFPESDARAASLAGIGLQRFRVEKTSSGFVSYARRRTSITSNSLIMYNTPRDYGAGSMYNNSRDYAAGYVQ